MKTFKIAVDWQMCGIVKIQAETLQDAIEQINNDPDIPLPEGEYIDGSFISNYSMSEELNK